MDRFNQPDGSRDAISRTSLTMLLTNQANALHSTGPRTPGGKARSAANALKHGLTGDREMLPGENPAAYRSLIDAVERRFEPAGQLERELCRRIAQLTWKLRRAPRAEAHMLRRQREELFDESDSYMRHVDESKRSKVRRYRPAGVIAEGFLREDHAALERLQRYETRIEQSLHATIRTLMKLRARAQNEPDSAEQNLSQTDFVTELAPFLPKRQDPPKSSI